MIRFAEGALTADITELYYESFKTYTFNRTLDPQLDDFLEKNLAFIDEQINHYTVKQPSEDPELKEYWTHINLIKLQLEGLYAGYLSKKSNPKMKLRDFYRFQLAGDIEDLLGSFDPVMHFTSKKQALRFAIERGHCSALIKYTPDRRELMVTQSTWDVYNNMLRIYKHIEIPFSNVASKSVSFSSSPGWLMSGDDFYITGDSQLVVIETTNAVFNTSLYQYVKPTSVLYWMRNIVANRLGNSGREWAKWFALYNSGTYNNQWLIVDYKKFVPNVRVSDVDLVIMSEQMPGYIKTQSVSHFLDTQRYIPSYNVPFDE
jgi:hypothetical protein